MPKVDIEEADLVKLQQGYTMLDKMFRKDRRGTQKLMKAVEPTVTIDDDVAAPYVEQIESLTKKFDALADSIKGDKIDAKLEMEFGELRKSGWTDEGLDKLKKFQIDRSIPSPLDAAAAWDRVNPPPKPQTPSTFSPSTWGIGAAGDDADLKLLFNDEDAWAEREAQKAWDEVSR